MVHEAFHVFQSENHPEWTANEADLGADGGARSHVMGISHAEFGPWGLRREYTLYDETAIWKQILLSTGEL